MPPSIRNHAQQLGSKTYWEQFGDAADYVILYIPGEHFLTAALEQDDRLWEWAFERRVLLATPTNLVAIARTVASVWRQEKIAEEAAEIARLGKELHSRLATMGGHVARMGRNLELATGAYNAFVGSLESQVLTQAKRFEDLEVSSGTKEIEALPVIEVCAAAADQAGRRRHFGSGRMTALELPILGAPFRTVPRSARSRRRTSPPPRARWAGRAWS